MNNQAFLNIISQAFQVYLRTGERSNEKLKIIHGFVANDLAQRLGNEYTISSLGYGAGREAKIQGRYVDKNVDITILRGGKPVAGVAVKYVMSNYSQNSNNYFENMLGETANIRAQGIPYFHILVLTQDAPYFSKDRRVSKIEQLTAHNLGKYIKLSQDDSSELVHSPDKTLIYIVKNVNSYDNFIGQARDSFAVAFADGNVFSAVEIPGVEFGDGVVLNDYTSFTEQITAHILGS